MQIDRVSASRPGRWRDLVPKAEWRNAERSLVRGDQGYLATIDGDYARRIWASRASHRDPRSGLRIRLAPGEAYAYAIEVDARYRPLGLAAALVATTLSDLREAEEVRRVSRRLARRDSDPAGGDGSETPCATG